MYYFQQTNVYKYNHWSTITFKMLCEKRKRLGKTLLKRKIDIWAQSGERQLIKLLIDFETCATCGKT